MLLIAYNKSANSKDKLVLFVLLLDLITLTQKAKCIQREKLDITGLYVISADVRSCRCE